MKHSLQFNPLNLLNLFIPNSTYIPTQKMIEVIPTANKNCSYPKEIIFEGKKTHTCTFSDCGKTFRYKSELIRHTIIHNAQRPLDCPFSGCKKTFKRDDVLKNHIRIHTGETPYKCQVPDCGESFISRARLKYHSLMHKEGKEYRCSFPGCKKKFLALSHLKRHESSLNCHQKISTQDSSCEDDELDMRPAKVVKFEDKSDTKLIVQESKYDEKEVKLENDTTLLQDEKTNKSEEENLMMVLKIIVAENNIIKKGLNKLYAMKKLMQQKKNTDAKGLSIQELSEKQTSDFVKSEPQ